MRLATTLLGWISHLWLPESRFGNPPNGTLTKYHETYAKLIDRIFPILTFQERYALNVECIKALHSGHVFVDRT
jgi:hypothetical protein